MPGRATGILAAERRISTCQRRHKNCPRLSAGLNKRIPLPGTRLFYFFAKISAREPRAGEPGGVSGEKFRTPRWFSTNFCYFFQYNKKKDKGYMRVSSPEKVDLSDKLPVSSP